MKDLYMQAIAFNKATAAKEFCKNSSIFAVQNAFWSVEYFDIYKSLLVDDLHQLGGAYKYLLQCTEIIMQEKGSVKLVNNRATAIPAFTGFRKFKAAYLPSGLKNPTYSELRAHMKILLPCIHDLVPLQAALCLRHFIDFYFIGTAKEHDYRSLKQMEFPLKMYNKYSPIFEQYSPSNMKFSKNHCLSKYIHDIESHGIVSAYTTNHSELQHKGDAKKPALRTNFHKSEFATQVSKFIVRRDLLYDQYPTPIRGLPVDDSHQLAKQHDFELSSPRHNGSPVALDKFERMNGPVFSHFYELVRHFLYKKTVDGNTRNPTGSSMPEPDTKSGYFYEELALIEYEDGKEICREIIRPVATFRGEEQRYYVKLKNGYYPQVLSLLKITYKNHEHHLFYGQKFNPAAEEHASGLEVTYAAETASEKISTLPSRLNPSQPLVTQLTQLYPSPPS
ncbi:hypothetical protein BJV82DRAFT_665654 [Fennellomyces sp. T-0311]|nr:hypothetical protein BJV82DRAFT_665654 [Fennellomyces sp. T-0311]